VDMTAALSAPRSEPANSHAFLPKAKRPSHGGAFDAVAGDKLMRLGHGVECHLTLPT
jgi:hypothetical protein